MSIQTIPLADIRRLLEDGKSLTIWDVRTPAEFASVHAQGARLMPLDKLDPAQIIAEISAHRTVDRAVDRTDAEQPVYVICQSGARAGKACEKLTSAGVGAVLSIEGGTSAWESAGLPVVRGTGKVISLERQVRIAAGLMVFVGTLLAWLISPWFLILPGFVGAGLAFSGITNTCGMAMVLAKMPFANKK